MESGYCGSGVGGQSLGLREECPFSIPTFSICKYILENSWTQAYVWDGSEPSLYCSPLNLHSVHLAWRDWLGIFGKLE